MVKAKHPASSATRSPLKSSSQQSIGNEQRERIISDLSVDQSLPANGTAESIPIVSNNHTHQQGNASKVTKKSSRPISKRLQLNDTWNNTETLQSYQGKTQQRTPVKQQQ
ncbi:unnamed protein product [Mucor circinelloides]